MATTLDTVRRDALPVARAGYPAGGLRFDWAVVALSGWLIGGIFLDGWAHNHYPDLETFFTPWHAALYSGFFALFAFLMLAAARNRGRGYAWRCVLPVGYDLSLMGGFIFLAGGVLDLIWHQVFGIEADTEALLSPTHLTLALGVTLMVSGPLRAAWRRPGAPVGHGARGLTTWAPMLPVLLALTFLLSLFTFFTQFAHPQVNTWATLDAAKEKVRGELFAMGRDGGGQTRLTVDPGQGSLYAAWSPDGRRLALQTGDDKSWQIAVMNADGSGRATLTDSKGGNVTPAWSPDGRRIAFSSTREGKGAIYAMNADGTGQVRLTRPDVNAYFPAWSPDGRTIAFHANYEGRWAIYAMNADGGGQTRLTSLAAGNFGPTWSPDGRRIAFTSQRDGHDEVYLMDVGGGGQARLTTGKADNWAPAWSPDGRAIAFLANRDKNDEVYLMDADGGGQTNLTRSPGTDENLPRWSPDGDRLVYTAQGHPATPAWLAINLGLAGILLQTTLLIGVILFAIRRWALPLGSLTLVFALTSLLISFMRDQYRLIPAALLAGLVADLLLWWLQPAAARPNAVHLFAFAVPLVFYALYFATLALTDGVGWSVHLWAGAAVMAGVVGVLLSYLIAPAAPAG